MKRKYSFSVFLLVILSTTIQAQSWIRVNQLGYLPGDIKEAVLVSRDNIQPANFEIHEALTGKVLYSSDKIRSFGKYGSFSSTFRLDFTGFKTQASAYIKAGSAVSPVFRISDNVYDGTADFLLNYMRQQRCGYNPFLHDSCHTHDGYIIYNPEKDSTHIDVTGGWHDATDYLQYTATSANAVYQMLLAYRQNPDAFGDRYKANGEPGADNVPDIVNEILWGMQWLVKMNPDSGEMYNQIADDRDHQGFRLPNEDRAGYGKGLERPVYLCTGKVQGIFDYKNRATGIASTAGKFASAFATGAIVLEKFDPELASLLKNKAIQAWEYGKANPGACQTAPCVSPYFYEEDNWVDDMELAGAALFELTHERRYLEDAVKYGRQETVTPWMGADTARHYQWYPFLNMGHWVIGKSADESYSEEFIKNWKAGIERVYQKAVKNPFLYGVPGIWCSNNLTVAMITQCHLYTGLSGDSTYARMEAALRDWLFGCNPWGTSMVVGLPGYGDSPSDPHSSLSVLKGYKLDGALVDGPVYTSIFRNLKGLAMAHPDEYNEFQSALRVYHDDYADYSTNEPTMDGTADFTYYLSAKEQEAHPGDNSKSSFEKSYGAIVRGDKEKKQIALVFTGHDQAEGLKMVLKTIKKQQVKASFFLTGDFYRNKAFASDIKLMKEQGHYMGGHSDKHLLYCDWNKRDSLLVNKSEFVKDLQANYNAMSAFGIDPSNTSLYLPPYEWYNDSIAEWCTQYGLTLINFTPGTSSNQDWTYPDKDINYISSDTIYARILRKEQTDVNGLNGFILLTHFGTDKRRTDKFYDRLDQLITDLKGRGYRFVLVHELLNN
jgi:peptidoglycan/xylan/chitin deacetylase (PgdA/CDA1 family)